MSKFDGVRDYIDMDDKERFLYILKYGVPKIPLYAVRHSVELEPYIVNGELHIYRAARHIRRLFKSEADGGKKIKVIESGFNTRKAIYYVYI